MNIIERKPTLDLGERSERGRTCDWRDWGDGNYLCVGVVDVSMQLNKDGLPEPRTNDHFLKLPPSLLMAFG